MPYFYYGIDTYYIILVLPAIILSLIAQGLVKSTFSKYSKMNCNLTGAEAAKRVLEANGVYDVQIEQVSGNLTDHYDPKTNVIRLSDSVYNTRSVAAVGVACHEAGHAVQYANSYLPIKLRSVIFPLANIGSQLSIPLIVLGMVFSFPILIDIGIIVFAAAVVFHLVTLPVEFNASRRAITAIKDYNVLLDDSEIVGARKVLTAAALTYVASFLLSLMQFLRLLAITDRRRR
jgi:Zn-dependent membrane protease YugP